MNTNQKAVYFEKRENFGLPKYTFGEEVLNCVTHAAGAALSVLALILMILKAANPITLVSVAVFGGTMTALYLNSAVYHGAKVNKFKKYLRIVDHCTIFLLIAGTYTPYTLITLRGPAGYTIFFSVWAMAIIGIILNIIDLKKFAKFSMVVYLLMGWCVVSASSSLVSSLHKNGIILLFAGGVAYTIGAVLYGLGKKIPYIHSVWHLFVLAGSILHFFSIYNYVIL